MFISGLIPFPISILLKTNQDIIEKSIKWADKQYKNVCSNNQPAVAILYLRGISLFRSLIVEENGEQHKYDDTKAIVDNYKDLNLDSNLNESLIRDRYVIIKKY